MRTCSWLLSINFIIRESFPGRSGTGLTKSKKEITSKAIPREKRMLPCVSATGGTHMSSNRWDKSRSLLSYQITGEVSLIIGAQRCRMEHAAHICTDVRQREHNPLMFHFMMVTPCEMKSSASNPFCHTYVMFQLCFIMLFVYVCFHFNLAN